MKHFVITGITKGMGLELGRALLQRGHRVSGCGRSAEKIAELSEEFQGRGFFGVADVLNAEEIRAWARKVINQYGPPDLLFNNAAVVNQQRNFLEISEGEFDRVIDINIKGVANVTRCFLQAMLKRESGVIVNMSSGWGRVGEAGMTAYCASKFGVEGFSSSLAKELPEGMACLTLSPGGVNTDMTLQCSGSHIEGNPSSQQWVEWMAPVFESFSSEDNGRVLLVTREGELRKV